MSKERPILFSAPMVCALLDGKKTQTRRIIKPQPPAEQSLGCGLYHPTVIDRNGEEQPGQEVFGVYSLDGEWSRPSPYGATCDRLIVRETFFAYGLWVTRFNAKKGRDEWHFVDMTAECDRRYQYCADNPDVPLATGRGGVMPGWYRRPAIFMPRSAARILLEITSVRVERLNDIGVEEIQAEGVKTTDAAIMEHGCRARVMNFASLWESINGAGSWSENPWVWVIEFKRVLT